MLAPSSPSAPTTPANRHEVAQFAKQGGFGDEERDMLQAQGLDDDMGGDHQAGGGVSPVYGPPEVLSTEEEQASPTFPKKWDVYVHLRTAGETEEEMVCVCCACIRLTRCSCTRTRNHVTVCVCCSQLNQGIYMTN